MPGRDLKHKPLVEAICELRWMLPTAVGPAALAGDPHYRLLLGRFSDRIQGDYPSHEPLPTAQVPDAMVPCTVQHRFRVGPNAWPLVQIGPGIMTVNDTAGYTWAGFGPRCIEAVKRLFDAHPSRQEFAVQELALRYIDAVDVDFEAEKVTDFIRDKLKIRIELPDALFVNGRVKPGPSAFAWHAAFPQDDPGGIISLRFSMGQHNGKPALIWETLVQTSRDGLPSLPDQFPAWLEKAHQITSDWFFTLIEGDLERRFRDGG